MTPAHVVEAYRRAFAVQTAVVQAGMTTRQIPRDTSPDAHGSGAVVSAIEAGQSLVMTDADTVEEPNGDVRIKLDTGTTVVTEDHVDLEDMV